MKYLLITIIAVFSGCHDEYEAKKPNSHPRFESYTIDVSNNYSGYIIKDNQTGLEYLVNNRGGIICLTPDAFTYQGVK